MEHNAFISCYSVGYTADNTVSFILERNYISCRMLPAVSREHYVSYKWMRK